MSKMHGCIAESIFTTECLVRDIPIYQPVADMYGIDFIVGHDLKKIQVKSTFVSDRRYEDKPTYKVQFSRGSESRRYDDGDFNFAAVYLYLLDVWYIIPEEHLNFKTIRINPNKITCKWYRYMEAWHLIAGENSSISKHQREGKKATSCKAVE